MAALGLINKSRFSVLDASLPIDIADHYRPDIDGLRAIAITPVVFFSCGCRAIQRWLCRS